MRLADIKWNDIVDGEGICVSVWVQGCPHRCFGCHNPETWSFNQGYEIEEQQTIKLIIDKIQANKVKRNLSILGGEPLCTENIVFVNNLLKEVRQNYPNIKIFLWTGYTLEELLSINNIYIKNILNNIDVLIDGRFILEERNITLKLRGSNNQRVLYKNIDF